MLNHRGIHDEDQYSQLGCEAPLPATSVFQSSTFKIALDNRVYLTFQLKSQHLH